MELTSEQFAEIVESVQRSANRDKGRDKRRAPRIEQNSKVVITPVTGTPAAPQHKQSLSVTVRNVSSRGMAILLNQWLNKGDQFVMKMSSKAGGGVSMLCTVAHCRRINGNLFFVGAEFACIVNEKPAQTGDDAMERHRISTAIMG
jgi:PilZ domain-containing protein